MIDTSLYCPSCRKRLYEYDFQLEGEVSGPANSDAFRCEACGWQGSCSELAEAPPAAEPVLDFQI